MREDEDGISIVEYDARCLDCMDFAPSYAVQNVGGRWSAGDRDADERDGARNICCSYCGEPVYSADESAVNVESETKYGYCLTLTPRQYSELQSALATRIEELNERSRVYAKAGIPTAIARVQGDIEAVAGLYNMVRNTKFQKLEEK